mgnify:CR=1 FL=1
MKEEQTNNLLEIISKILRQIPNQKDLINKIIFPPFSKSQRNNSFRNQILKKIISSILTDDERAKYYSLPTGCRMREGVIIYNQEKLTIGENVFLGSYVILDATSGLTIGSNTTLGPSVKVFSHSTYLANLNFKNDIGINQDLFLTKQTKIGRGCFVGANSVIAPGVNIGDKCFIHPLTYVKEDVPERSVITNQSIQKGVLTEKNISRLKQINSGLN